MAMRQEVNAPLILTVGAVSGVMVLVVMIGLHAWYLNEELREQTIKLESAPVPELMVVAHQPPDEALARAMRQVADSGGKVPTTRPTTRPATQPAAGPTTRPNAAPARSGLVQ